MLGLKLIHVSKRGHWSFFRMYTRPALLQIDALSHEMVCVELLELITLNYI